MSFSRPGAPPHQLAAWLTRGGAQAIDVLIIGAVELALLLIVWALSGGPRWTLTHAETVAFEVGLPVAVLYAPLLLARRGERNGQTIGKRAMGIRVVRMDGLPLTFATAFVREGLGRQVPALLTSGLYVPVDYLWALWDPRRQALHDKVGRTFVVLAAGSGPAPESRREPVPDASPTPSQPVHDGWLPPVAPSRGTAD